MFNNDVKSAVKLLVAVFLIAALALVISSLFSSASAETYLEKSGYVEWDEELVKDLQRGLNDHLKFVNKHMPKGKKFDKLTVDGDLGPATIDLLKHFQKFKGLTPDGICGPKTWKALGYDHTTSVYYAPDLFKQFDRGSSDYAFLLTLDDNKFRVYEIKEDGWELIYSWKAATGNYSEGNLTPTGTFILKNGDQNHSYIYDSNKSKWRAANATRVTHSKDGYIYIHSTLELRKNGEWVKDTSKVLGKHVTHGCIRLAPENAEWVAKHRNGTVLVILDKDPI